MKRAILLLILLTCTSLQGQIYIDVDVAVELFVNKHPIQASDGTVDEGVTYDEAGMDLIWHFIPCSGGSPTSTAITPTSGGVYDWTHLDGGVYKIEMPASGGGSANNDTEGSGYFTGDSTATLAWSSYVYIFRSSSSNDAYIEGGDIPDVSLTQIGGDAQSATDLKDFADAGYDPSNDGTNVYTVRGAAPRDADTDAATISLKIATDMQNDPTDYTVNVMEIGGTSQTANDNGADINAILEDTGTTLPASIAAISTSGAAWGSTTVASPSSTTVFTITDGVTEDSVYVGFLITVTDADGDNLPEPAFVKSYVSSTKTITLSTPLSFTPANADTVSFLAGFGRGSGVTIFRRKGL